MAAAAGPAPWSGDPYYDFQAGYKRLTAKDKKRLGIEHNLGSGYRDVKWDKEPRKPQMETITLYNGRKVQVPKGDYDDYIGFQRSETSLQGTDIAKYIQQGWETATQEVDGVGHIYNIKYNPRMQLLWVEFSEADSGAGGAVVVFFRVPKEVYSELYHLATSGGTAISWVDGKQRHMLGMKFWDIVRIRGQRTGSRYRYEYQVDNTSIGTQYERSTEAADSGIDKYSGVDRQNEDKEVYDRLARNKLSGSRLDEYRALKTNAERSRFLRRAQIL